MRFRLYRMPDRPTESSDSVQSTPNPDKELMSVPVLRDKLALLGEALEAISDGFVLYDRDDRFLAFNSKHRDLFPSIAELLEPGVSHRALLEGQLRLGHFRIDPTNKRNGSRTACMSGPIQSSNDLRTAASFASPST